MDTRSYRENLSYILNSTEFKGINDELINFEEGIKIATDLIKGVASSGGKIVFIGNGGSAAIASHGAIDYLKNGKMKSISLNDASLLTCFSNDYGYEHVFDKPLAILLDKKDILIAISSSGKSQNILNAVDMSKQIGAKSITLSGFLRDNPLKRKGNLNIYADSSHFGMVELVHQIIVHMILDMIVENDL